MEYVIWISLAVGVVVFIISYIYIMRTQRKKQQTAIQNFRQKVSEFEAWREGIGIRNYRVLGGYQIYDYRNAEGLMIDTSSRKLCKALTCFSYDFTEITGVEINKQFARESVGASNSSRAGVSYGKRSVRGSNSSAERSSVRRSQDVSTYSVLIQTNLIDNSLIAIPCGTGRETAEEIKATVKNIIADNKKAAKQGGKPTAEEKD